MNNGDTSTVIVDKKKKNKIFIVVGIIIGVLLIGLFLKSLLFNYGYHSIDKKNDDQVNDYLLKYMKDKYDVNVSLSLKKKELINICLLDIDGCIFEAKNKNIYKYEYTGYDSDDNRFIITYTNDYIGNNQKHDSKIEDNYEIYVEQEKLEKLLLKYSDEVDIYNTVYDEVLTNSKENYDDISLVIRMYVDKIDKNQIIELFNKLDDFEYISDAYITTDKDVYTEIIPADDYNNDSYSFFDALSNDNKYTQVDNNEHHSHYFSDELDKLNFDNDSMYYTLTYYSSINIFQKQK